MNLKKTIQEYNIYVVLICIWIFGITGYYTAYYVLDMDIEGNYEGLIAVGSGIVGCGVGYLASLLVQEVVSRLR